jgi:uncharacterized protein (TIGR00730 family)
VKNVRTYNRAQFHNFIFELFLNYFNFSFGLADAFIALPGGFGTLEELVEATTWSQLRIHSKPVGILNTNGYYDMFIKWMDNAVAEGFIDAKSRRIVVVRDTPTELLNALYEYQDPISDSTWILSTDMWKRKGLKLEDV